MKTDYGVGEQPKVNEYRISWQNINHAEKACVLTIYCKVFDTKDVDDIRRIFDAGKPDMFFDYDLSNCRIAKQSLDLMASLFSPYMKSNESFM